MTECYCDYDDTLKVGSVNMRKARKQHKCYECNGAIRIDERYEQVDALWDDGAGWEHYKICARCVGLREYTKAHVPCLCWYYGNVIDDCMETIREWEHEAPGLLFGAYRRLVWINQNRYARDA